MSQKIPKYYGKTVAREYRGNVLRDANGSMDVDAIAGPFKSHTDPICLSWEKWFTECDKPWITCYAEDLPRIGGSSYTRAPAWYVFKEAYLMDSQYRSEILAQSLNNNPN